MCHIKDGCIVLPNLGEDDGIAGSHILFGNPLMIEKQLNHTSSLVNGGNSPAFRN
jgi:hypothetical protein